MAMTVTHPMTNVKHELFGLQSIIRINILDVSEVSFEGQAGLMRPILSLLPCIKVFDDI